MPGALAFAVLPILLATAPVSQPATPRIQFEATELDLGDVIHGQDAIATFTYRNTGTAPLRILSAKPG